MLKKNSLAYKCLNNFCIQHVRKSFVLFRADTDERRVSTDEYKRYMPILGFDYMYFHYPEDFDDFMDHF